MQTTVIDRGITYSQVLATLNVEEERVDECKFGKLRYDYQNDYADVANVVTKIALSIILVVGYVLTFAVVIAPLLPVPPFVHFLAGALLLIPVGIGIGFLSFVLWAVEGVGFLAYFRSKELKKIEVLKLNFGNEINIETDMKMDDFMEMMNSVYREDKIFEFMSKMNFSQLSDLKQQLTDDKFKKYIKEYIEMYRVNDLKFNESIEMWDFILDLKINEVTQTKERFLKHNISELLTKHPDFANAVINLIKDKSDYVETIKQIRDLNPDLTIDNENPKSETIVATLQFKDGKSKDISEVILMKFKTHYEEYSERIEESKSSDKPMEKELLQIDLTLHNLETFEMLLKILENQSMKVDWEQACCIIDLAENLVCDEVISRIDGYFARKLEQHMPTLDKSGLPEFFKKIKQSEAYSLLNKCNHLKISRKKFVELIVSKCDAFQSKWEMEDYIAYHSFAEEFKKEFAISNDENSKEDVLLLDCQKRINKNYTKNSNCINYMDSYKKILTKEQYDKVVRDLCDLIKNDPKLCRSAYEKVAAKEEKVKKTILEVIKDSKDKNVIRAQWSLEDLPSEINTALRNGTG